MNDEMLSEEMIELYSSFDTNWECEMSYDTNSIGSPFTSSSLRCVDITLDKPERPFSKPELQQSSNKQFTSFTSGPNKNCLPNNGFVSDESLLNSTINSSLILTEMFNHFSLDQEQFPSSAKLKEFKRISYEVNDAYINWMISQFLVDVHKEIKHQVPSQLAVKVEAALSIPTLNQFSVIKKKTGGSFNILGLEDDDINSATNVSLSSLEKEELNKQSLTLLKSYMQQVCAEKKALKDVFGGHCQRVVHMDSLLCEEHERLAVLYQCIQNQLDQACQLLVSNNQLMQQLTQVLKSSEQDLQTATYNSLLDKATYIQSVIRVLKLKMEQHLYRDKYYTKATNSLGSELKSSVDAMNEELKSLQKTLGEYEKKEESSRRYKALVADYAKTKRQLHHKYQTLSVLNDPDTSFS